MAGQIPSPYAIAPSGMAPGRLIEATPDPSGLIRGADALANAADNVSADVTSMSGFQQQQDNALDVAKAEALKTKGFVDMAQSFQNDPDYATFVPRATLQSQDILASASNVIRDPTMKARWLADAGTSQQQAVGAIGNQANSLKNSVQRVAYAGTLEDNAKLATDPTLPPQVRAKALSDIQGTIDVGTQTGIFTPAEGISFKKQYLVGSEQQLALNTAGMNILSDPASVMTKVGVPTAPAGNELVTAQQTVAGGTLPLDPALASMVAAKIGDAAFPSNPKAQAAYLTDPTVNAKYAAAATTMLTDRYKGDMTAAVIAAAPGGGTALADKWVASNHDESVLPVAVRTYYGKVMQIFAPSTGMVDIPLKAGPGIDLSTIDTPVLDRFEKVQSAFGRALPIIQGQVPQGKSDETPIGGAQTSQGTGVRSLDVDVSSLSNDERGRLIQTASAMGFGGVGVYKDSLHLDAGDPRAWGETGQSDSVPSWAQPYIDAHGAGTHLDVPPNYQPVDPTYQALTFDQRLQVYNEAKHALDQNNVAARAGVSVALDNAPAAIANTGTYSGFIPGPNDFVAAFGASEGVQKWQDFDATLDTAHTTYGMRTMPANQILQAVQASAPTGADANGDDAGAQWQKYEKVSSAAQAVLKQRADDPAAYVQSAFPDVATAWTGATDPQSFGNAISLTAQAEKKLGIADGDMALLPDTVAKNAAANFKNVNLPSDQRIGAITGLAMLPTDPTQRAAIFSQLVKAGVPEFTQGAMAALERGDMPTATQLFRAAMVDPTKLPGVVADKTADLKQTIQSTLFDNNGLASTVYGLTNGTTQNFNRAAQDGELLTRGAQLRLMDGSTTDPATAVAMTAKDLFGDLKVVTSSGGNAGAGMKVAVPSGEDQQQLQAGFNGLLANVQQAASASVGAALPSASPSIESRDEASASGQATVINSIRDNYVRSIVSNGYFANAAGGFNFIDPKTGTAIPGPTGKPLLFTLNDVHAAAAASAQRNTPQTLDPRLGLGPTR